jgi:hypothetical protein
MAFLQMRSETGEGMGSKVCGTERVAGWRRSARASACGLMLCVSPGRLVADCIDQGARS